MTAGDLTVATCPYPHDTRPDSDGYCPICGLATGAQATESGVCAGCGAARTGDAFCERCGHQHEREGRTAARRPGRWVVLVSADRRQFDALDGGERGFEFRPPPDREIELTSDLVRIGSAADDTDVPPEVDLGGPLADPGVSRQHAELLRHNNGSWVVRDVGSTNGTFVGRHRLATGAVAPLTDGDRIRVGLWTRITLIGT